MKPPPPALYAVAGLALLEAGLSQPRQLIEELAEEEQSSGQPSAFYSALLASVPDQPGALEIMSASSSTLLERSVLYGNRLMGSLASSWATPTSPPWSGTGAMDCKLIAATSPPITLLIC